MGYFRCCALTRARVHLGTLHEDSGAEPAQASGGGTSTAVCPRGLFESPREDLKIFRARFGRLGGPREDLKMFQGSFWEARGA